MRQAHSSHEPTVEAGVTVSAPASLSNLGPGFDCLGLAISGWGDRVDALPNDRGILSVRFDPTSAWKGPTSIEKNTAGRAAENVLKLLGVESGVELVIYKGIIPGSGAGSSAASAAAAAFAVAQLFDLGLGKEDLVDAVLDGESIASGSRHGDNALPALFGGAVVVSAQNPLVYRRIRLLNAPSISILLPEMEILTKLARRILPDAVPFRSAVENASNLALMISALQEGDWKDVGRFMMLDQFAEPARSELIPGFSEIRAAAVEAGAFGCALSGSGPAVFALSESDMDAQRVLDAMLQSARAIGLTARGVVTHVEEKGASRVVQEPPR